jgi:hypothetical protein
MKPVRLLALAAGLATLLAISVTPISAQEPEEETQVVVNLQGVAAELPQSVAVPPSIAAVACGISQATLTQAQIDACAAETKTFDLVRAIAEALVAAGQADVGSAVNVDIQALLLQLPPSVQLPIGAVADVCGSNLPTLQPTGETACDAQAASINLTEAIAEALLLQ